MSLPEHLPGFSSPLTSYDETHTREHVAFDEDNLPLYSHDRTLFREDAPSGRNGFDLANAFLHARVIHPGDLLEISVDLRNGEPPVTQTAMYWEPQHLSEQAVHAFLPAEPHSGMGLMLQDSIVGWKRVGHVDLHEWAEKVKALQTT